MRRAATLLAAVLLVSGCGTDGDKPSSVPSSSPVLATVTPPAGVTLASPGTRVRFGQSADVGFSPTAKRATTLALTVTGVRTGRIADLSAYALDVESRAATPYYVRATVKNLGPDDVAGSAIPLWVETSTGATIGAASFSQPFARCRSTALPSSFSTGVSTSTCLLYLVPQGATLVSVSNRSTSGDVAVTWTGTVKPPRHKKR